MWNQCSRIGNACAIFRSGLCDYVLCRVEFFHRRAWNNADNTYEFSRWKHEQTGCAERPQARARETGFSYPVLYAVIIAGTSWNNTAPAHYTVTFSSLNPDCAPRTLYSRVSSNISRKSFNYEFPRRLHRRV